MFGPQILTEQCLDNGQRDGGKNCNKAVAHRVPTQTRRLTSYGGKERNLPALFHHESSSQQAMPFLTFFVVDSL